MRKEGGRGIFTVVTVAVEIGIEVKGNFAPFYVILYIVPLPRFSYPHDSPSFSIRYPKKISEV